MTGARARAVAAAVDVARRHAVHSTDPVVLSDKANVIVHLRPTSVVARVAAATAVVRRDPEACLARDVAVAGFAAAQGAPVVAPSSELPPGPHRSNGRVLTFWTYVEHDRERKPTAADLGRMLHELHDVLRGFPGELPLLWPARSDPSDWLDALTQHRLAPLAELHRLRHELAASNAALAASALPVRAALHGDAHARNVLMTRDGPRWTDFEETCRGPIAWDLACLGARSGPEALRSYGDDRPNDAELAPFVEARRVQGAIWNLVAGARDRGALDGLRS